MSTEKKFRIVKIIDGQHIVINGGSDNNLHEGQIFRIFGVHGPQVTDPQTHEDLGRLQPFKGKVQIETVYEKMSICTSVPHEENFSPIAGAGRTFKTYPELNVDSLDITGTGLDDDKEIRIGDEVIS
jgi:hypothetical protein